MNEENESKYCQQVLRKNNLHPIKKLGRGAYGTVYLVSRASSKTSSTELLSVKCTNKNNFVKKPMLRRYLKQEIDIHSQIQHPNVVKLTRSFQDQNWIFMVMEYCELGNLYHFQAHKPSKVFQLSEAQKYMGDILDGLIYLHSNGIIHRDLKLENILLTKDQKTQQIRAKLCDFGFAKEVEETSTFCGTTYFMAPQIFAKKKYDCSVDIWAAGVIFFHMLFAVYPFKSMNMAAEIQTKCKNGFAIEMVKGVDVSAFSKDEKAMLDHLFLEVFRLNSQDRLGLQEFRKLMVVDEEKKVEDGSDTESDGGPLEIISQKINFLQKTCKQITELGFLTNWQELALKYYIDKYCLTLLLSSRKQVQKSQHLAQYKQKLTQSQQKESTSLKQNLPKLEIARLLQIFSPSHSSQFTTYKQAYRMVLSHIFSKANKQIQDIKLRSQLKLKIFCCHSINRVFQEEYFYQVFGFFVAWNNRNYHKNDIRIQDVAKWIEDESVDRVNQTVKILCEKFYGRGR